MKQALSAPREPSVSTAASASTLSPPPNADAGPPLILRGAPPHFLGRSPPAAQFPLLLHPSRVAPPLIRTRLRSFAVLGAPTSWPHAEWSGARADVAEAGIHPTYSPGARRTVAEVRAASRDRTLACCARNASDPYPHELCMCACRSAMPSD